MRHFFLMLIDLALIAVATEASLLLRDNFEFFPAHAADTLPYLLGSLASGAVLLTAFGAYRVVWAFATTVDYLRIVMATIATIICAVTLGFVVNRLDGVARALPLLQGALMVIFLLAARAAARLRRGARGAPWPRTALAPRCRTVLVVGVGDLGGLYLAAVARHAPHRIRIAGFLDRDERHIGRSVHGHPILGSAEQVAEMMRKLEPHGVFVDAIVVAEEFDMLSPRAQQALLELEAESDIAVELLVDRLGLCDGADRGDGEVDERAALDAVDDARVFACDSNEITAALSRPYWRVKRVLDVIGALTLTALLAPLLTLGFALALIDVGWPPTFWQQRPGRYGRPFKVFKLRTMAAAHDAEGRRVSDELRVSALGNLSRRLRLDELPQLLNVLTGEMSFVGPRPLLPVDQPRDCAARLMIRPGLTGWAQVNGGRAISATDKAALDVWYVRNASLALDVEIVLRTILVVIIGERVDAAAIRRAWREVRLVDSAAEEGAELVVTSGHFLAESCDEPVRGKRAAAGVS
ncbi:MAG TPA: sugar transferase [Methylosinus sp.]|jgi:lipopolysaccharide/colanic/teichoic acid biosynthesis glycosyltransferase